MNILWLSTGLFRDRYGQQNYESHFLNSSYKFWGEFHHFKVLLLNDIRVPAPWNCYSGLSFSCCGRKSRFFSKLKFGLFSLSYVIRYRPALIICGHINLSILCLLFLRFFKIRYIILTYGIDSWNIKDRLRKMALKEAHAIVTISSYTASKIKEQIPSLREIFIIPAFIDTQKFSPFPKPDYLLKRYNLKDCKIILTVARLSSIENKGYDKVVRLLPALIKIAPQIRYFIVGAGDDTANIIKLIAQLGLKDYVILTGFIPYEELEYYYNLCDLFIMPSKQEGLGIVFLEALACGKPVIAGNQDGSREALLDGKLGLLVNPDDINEITEAIIKVLRRDADRNLLDANFLRQSVIENFGLECFKHRVSGVLSYIHNER